MENSGYGGLGYIALYRMTDDHADVADKATGAAIATPVIGDVALILNEDDTKEYVIETTDITYDDQGVPTIKVTSNIPDIVTFLQTAAPRKAGTTSTTRAEKTGETGKKRFGASGGTSDPKYLLIQAGTKHGTKVETIISIGQVKRTSGGRSRKAGEDTMPSFEFVGHACKKTGGFVALQALFDATIWGTISAGDRTIPKDQYVQEGFFAGV